MEPEIRTLVEQAVKDATLHNWYLYVIIIVASFLAGYLGSYLREKGKNLATKEDVAEITQKVEEVRSQYAERMENISLQNRLRLSALEKRLETHQQAYTLWSKLVGAVNEEKEINAVVRECQDWWIHNCLFLEPEVREAFVRAYLKAQLHRHIIGKPHATVEEMESSWETIMRPGPLIIEAVGLPPIAEDKPTFTPPEAAQAQR